MGVTGWDWLGQAGWDFPQRVHSSAKAEQAAFLHVLPQNAHPGLSQQTPGVTLCWPLHLPSWPSDGPLKPSPTEGCHPGSGFPLCLMKRGLGSPGGGRPMAGGDGSKGRLRWLAQEPRCVCLLQPGAMPPQITPHGRTAVLLPQKPSSVPEPSRLKSAGQTPVSLMSIWEAVLCRAGFCPRLSLGRLSSGAKHPSSR